MKRRLRRIATFFAVMGPGIITANVDNDAGGIATYSIAGARTGYELLWTMIPITIALIIVQEMTARMGVVTGKGLADLIRERYGIRATFFVMVLLLLVNIGNIFAEFSGIRASSEIFGIPSYISVPLGALFVWWLVVKGRYKSVEKVFLVACLFYLSYIISGIIARPSWDDIMSHVLHPTLKLDRGPLFITIGLIGTTIAPWMQFFQQAATVEKGVKLKNYAYSRLDTIIGGIVVSIVASFIIITCGAKLYPMGIHISSAEEAALALEPLAGKYCSILFAFGLLNASLFAASILPLSTAYSVCEAFGWESGVNKRFSQAPTFYALYTGLILLGGAGALIPSVPLIQVMYWSQILNGILLPVVLFCMLSLINNKEVMGEYVNSGALNLISWITIISIVILTFLAVIL